MRRGFPLAVVVVGFLVASVALAQEGGRKPVRPPSEEESFPMTYKSPYPPPKPLKNVRGHWTPYDPPDPASFPADAQVHTIGQGETLWTLAESFYSDSLLWPFLWESNAYITDPHWIYPGDPLLVPSLQIVPPLPVEPVDVPIPGIEEAFVPAGSLSDMYCSFFIDEEDWTRWDTMLIGSDDALRLSHATWDIMYINKGRDEGIQGGEEYTVLAHSWKLDHVITGEPLGHVIRRIARARVLYVQEHTSTVAIIDSCTEVQPGYRLMPFEPMQPPLMERDPWFDPHAVEPTFDARGHVVWTVGGIEGVGTFDKVSIDLGSDDGILPGDHFMAYRNRLDDRLQLPNEVIGGGFITADRTNLPAQAAEEVYFNASRGTEMGYFQKRKMQKAIGDLKVPPRYLAELVVLETQPSTSTAMVVYSVREIGMGDMVELKGGEPK